jgi:hypothetical protein
VAGARSPRPRWQPPSTLPPLYAGWIADLLDGPPPGEAEATCESCAMWPPAGAPAASDAFFHPDTKCCTYVPEIPNFLVGRILDDADPALAPGRASVERRIDARVGVTPIGLVRPPVQALLYQHGAPAGFGRAASLRCPHYRVDAGGACGIWRHRNGVCSTWFCKHGRGATGQRFWQALEQLLAVVERDLARWCLLQVGVDAEVLARLLPRRADRGADGGRLDAAGLDGTVRAATYRALWGSWHGRERDFFRRAAALVNDLRWADVRRIGGAGIDVFARVTVDAHRRHGDDEVPGRLAVGAFHVVVTGRDRVRVMTYSEYDPLELPRLLVDVLPYFDGRPTAEALRRIRAERDINVRPGLVRRLVDFGILVEPASSAEP